LSAFKAVGILDVCGDLKSGSNNPIEIFISVNFDRFEELSTSTFDDVLLIDVIDQYVNIVNLNDFDRLETTVQDRWEGLIPWVDLDYSCNHHTVRLLSDKPTPPSEFKYTPTTNFEIGSELIGFTTNFIKPIDFDKLVTPLSPVDGGSGNLPWVGLNELITLDKSINYGYSINAFVISGGTNASYPVDEDALVQPPIDPPSVGEVIHIVNIVNVVVLPSRTPIIFTNLVLSIDLNSVAWTAKFDIADLASLALIKPSGASRKEVEININGDLFNVFIALK
jgi:hypothetical protein